MPPTPKKLEGHIASGTFVCPSVTLFLEFHIWILHEEIADRHFLSHQDYAPFLSYGPFKKYG